MEMDLGENGHKRRRDDGETRLRSRNRNSEDEDVKKVREKKYESSDDDDRRVRGRKIESGSDDERDNRDRRVRGREIDSGSDDERNNRDRRARGRKIESGSDDECDNRDRRERGRKIDSRSDDDRERDDRRRRGGGKIESGSDDDRGDKDRRAKGRKIDNGSDDDRKRDNRRAKERKIESGSDDDGNDRRKGDRRGRERKFEKGSDDDGDDRRRDDRRGRARKTESGSDDDLDDRKRDDRRGRGRKAESGSDDDRDDRERDDRRLERRRTERGGREDEKDGSRQKRRRDEREDGGGRRERKSRDEGEEDDDSGERDDRRERRQRNDRDDDIGKNDRKEVNEDQTDDEDDRRKRRRRDERETGYLKDDRKERSRRNEDERDDRRRQKADEESRHRQREEVWKERRRDIVREKKLDSDDDNRQRVRDDKLRKEKNREDNALEDGAMKVSEDSKVQKLDGNLNADAANLGRTGGVYIPPFKLARMMKEIQDKSSVEYQRMTWDALRKSINGLVNKVNAANLKNIIPELFAENLIRGRGLFCRSCMKSQMASPGFTDVFAALVAVVNTKFPEVGDLLLRRIVLQLRRAYKRNDKAQLLAAIKFIAHLVNQQVVHELIALELLAILLDKPSDDSVEVAVGFVTECGSMLQDLVPRGLHGVFEGFRGILHEGEIDIRVQFLIESLFALRKANFKGYPAVRPELDLVEQEDQLTHEISFSDEIDPEISLDIFKPDPNFLENERKYEELKKALLGEESEEERGSDAESEDGSDEDEEDEEEDEQQMKITDETETNLINLRRTIYLTIMSSVDFEEAGHKLLKIKLEPGQEMELCVMLLECCSQERTYLRYYGLLGQRFCMINKVHQENFEKCFVQQYSMIHRLETNKLRNVAKFFAHLLGTDALPWHVLAYIRLTEEDTTSSSRIFIKILFQELSEHLGIRLLNERLNDPTMQDSFDSIFPKDNPKNTRFAINFFTSIGLGGITENLREYLKTMPRLIMQQQKTVSESEESGSSSDSESSGPESDSGSSSDKSDSESDDSRRKRRRRR